MILQRNFIGIWCLIACAQTFASDQTNKQKKLLRPLIAIASQTPSRQIMANTTRAENMASGRTVTGRPIEESRIRANHTSGTCANAVYACFMQAA